MSENVIILLWYNCSVGQAAYNLSNTTAQSVACPAFWAVFIRSIMKRYDGLIRTTIGEYLLDEERYWGGGVYIIACYPSLGCVYIGRSENIEKRIRTHLGGTHTLGVFMRNVMADSVGFRLDILCGEDREWQIQAERALIDKFSPMINLQPMNVAEHLA